MLHKILVGDTTLRILRSIQSSERFKNFPTRLSMVRWERWNQRRRTTKFNATHLDRLIVHNWTYTETLSLTKISLTKGLVTNSLRWFVAIVVIHTQDFVHLAFINLKIYNFDAICLGDKKGITQNFPQFCQIWKWELR